MLPASDNRNNDIRQLSRYGKVIEFITGTTHVSSGDAEASFDALWEQCTQLAVQESVSLGTVNQGAGTFYNTICAHKNLKAALLSSKRIAVPITAKEATSAPGHNGVYFDGVRTNTRVPQLPSAAPDAPSPAQTTPSVPSSDAAAARDLSVFRAASTPSAIGQYLPSPAHTTPVGECLPNGLCIPHLSCEAAWRAWWTVTESLPLPLRFCSKKIPKGPNHAAECTRLSRIKTVIVDPQTRICQFTFDSMLHVTGNPHCFILSQCSH
jgi:hypothetical protein